MSVSRKAVSPEDIRATLIARGWIPLMESANVWKHQDPIFICELNKNCNTKWGLPKPFCNSRNVFYASTCLECQDRKRRCPLYGTPGSIRLVWVDECWKRLPDAQIDGDLLADQFELSIIAPSSLPHKRPRESASPGFDDRYHPDELPEDTPLRGDTRLESGSHRHSESRSVGASDLDRPHPAQSDQTTQSEHHLNQSSSSSDQQHSTDALSYSITYLSSLSDDELDALTTLHLSRLQCCHAERLRRKTNG